MHRREYSTEIIARGGRSRNSYSTRRSRVLYDISRSTPECNNFPQSTSVDGALTGLQYGNLGVKFAFKTRQSKKQLSVASSNLQYLAQASEKEGVELINGCRSLGDITSSEKISFEFFQRHMHTSFERSFSTGYPVDPSFSRRLGKGPSSFQAVHSVQLVLVGIRHAALLRVAYLASQSIIFLLP